MKDAVIPIILVTGISVPSYHNDTSRPAAGIGLICLMSVP
jgi:hypothetical protein